MVYNVNYLCNWSITSMTGEYNYLSSFSVIYNIHYGKLCTTCYTLQIICTIELSALDLNK